MNQHIRILMIVRDPYAFDSQINFLRRRGWDVAAVSSLREGIEYIVGKSPDFVIISINHPNPKVVKMPSILSQTFNARSILIGESLDSQTAAALTKSGRRDIIHAPVSGPGIQLRIKQILARERQAANAAGRDQESRQSFLEAKNEIKKGREELRKTQQESLSKTNAPSVAQQLAGFQKPGGSGPAIIQKGSGKPHVSGPAYNPLTSGGQAKTHQKGEGQNSPPNGFEALAENPANKFAELPPVAPLANEFDFTAEGSSVAPKKDPEAKEKGQSSLQQPGTTGSNGPTHFDPQGQGEAPGHYNPQLGQDTFGKPNGESGVTSGSPVSRSPSHAPPRTADANSTPSVPEADHAKKTPNLPTFEQEGANKRRHEDTRQDQGNSSPGYEDSGQPQDARDASDAGDIGQFPGSEPSRSKQDSESESGEEKRTDAHEPTRGTASAENASMTSAAEDQSGLGQSQDPRGLGHPSQDLSQTDESDEKQDNGDKGRSPEDYSPLEYQKKGKRAFEAKSTIPPDLTDQFGGSDIITVLRIVREAFQDSLEPLETMEYDSEKLYHDAYYINVEGTSGFLFYTAKSKARVESHLVPKINTKIIDGLKQTGFSMESMTNIENNSIGDLNLTIDEIYKSSKLTLFSGEGESSFALSYLECELGIGDLLEDKSKNMVGFPIDAIPPNSRSPFKVFLYLPINKKYYLYLNKGNWFSDKQISNLAKKGVSHLHIKDEDKEFLDNYFMSKRLYDQFKKIG